MKHASYLFAAALVVIQSRAYASGPTPPVSIDPATEALSPIIVDLLEDTTVHSLVVDSRIFSASGRVLEASTGEVAVADGVDDLVVDVGAGVFELENPQRVTLEPGVYCEQLSVTSLVDGYDAAVEFTRFAYFEVTGDAIEAIGESDYARQALTLTPIQNAKGEFAVGSAGNGQLASESDLRLPTGDAALIESGDDGSGAVDRSERNER